jgi:hypothetical protein
LERGIIENESGSGDEGSECDGYLTVCWKSRQVLYVPYRLQTPGDQPWILLESMAELSSRA